MSRTAKFNQQKQFSRNIEVGADDILETMLKLKDEILKTCQSNDLTIGDKMNVNIKLTYTAKEESGDLDG